MSDSVEKVEQKNDAIFEENKNFNKDLVKKKFKLKQQPFKKLENNSKTFNLNDIFENPVKNPLEKRIINLEHLPKSLNSIAMSTAEQPFEVVQMNPTKNHDSKEDPAFVTLNELKNNRLTQSELKELTVYKNYVMGDESNKIYIKNIAKQVQETDIKRIYGRYVNWSCKIDSNAFSIRLMQEGRMKGQCFITFQTNNQARQAIEETNGFLLCEKPIIVQYGKANKNT